MNFSTDFIFRILGAIFSAVAAGIGGFYFSEWLGLTPDVYVIVFGLVGVLTGLILTPYITTRPIRRIRKRLSQMTAGRLAAFMIGIFLGLVAAALLSLPLSLLPAPFRQIMPLATAVIFCYLSVIILTTRQNDLQSLFNSFRPGNQAKRPMNKAARRRFIRHQRHHRRPYHRYQQNRIYSGHLTDP